MTAIGNDAATPMTNLDVEDDVVDDFLKRLMPPDAETPSEKTPEEKEAPKPEGDEMTSEGADKDKNADKSAEETQPDEDADEDKSGEADKDEDRKLADDGAYVKVKVGDEEHEVPIKDLSRLYGQEQSLTKKSMEVAETRKAVDAELAKNVAASSTLLERAKAKFEPYSKIDFLLAAKELSAEDYTNLRQAAQAAYEDVQFLEKNLTQFVTDAQQRQHTALVEQAKEALKVLGGPVDQGGIEGWNEKLYGDIRAFGTSAGLKKEIVDNLVDPAAIRLLYDAMLYRRGKEKVVVTKRVNKTPAKVVKTSRPQEQGVPGDKTKANAALRKLRTSGSTDDAAEAMLASWASRDSE